MKKSMKTQVASLKGKRAELLMKVSMLSSLMRDLRVESECPIEVRLTMIGHMTLGTKHRKPAFNGVALAATVIEDMLYGAEPEVISRYAVLAGQVVMDWIDIESQLLLLARNPKLKPLLACFETLEQPLGFTLDSSEVFWEEGQ